MIADPQTVDVDRDGAADVLAASLAPTWLLPQQLAALPLDEVASTHVWSTELGYPGDPLYRDGRRDAQSGLAYWSGGADSAAPYDPYYAFRRAQEHATHFVTLLAQRAGRCGGPLVVPLDLDLLGVRWFEGSAWLRAVLMQCATHPEIRLATPATALRGCRPRAAGRLRPGSWSPGGDHTPWHGAGAAIYWRELHAAETRLAAMVRLPAPARSTRERLLNQALRELLLAQSSDWPLLLSAGIDVAEATRRWRGHLRRCMLLCDRAGEPEIDSAGLADLDQLEEQDNPFPSLNYRIFEE